MQPILFYFVISSELDPLKIDQIVLPLRSPPVVCHFLSFRHYPGVFSVGCCVVFDFGGRPPKARTYFFLFSIINFR